MSFTSETKFEDALIQLLIDKGWHENVINRPTEQDLIDNWAEILFQNNRGIDRLNNEPLTDGEMQQLIELEDFPQLEHVLHRLYGATRYVGTPSLQEATGSFEQFVSTLRKERRKADDAFIQEVLRRFDELQAVIAQVEHAAEQILNKHTQ